MSSWLVRRVGVRVFLEAWRAVASMAKPVRFVVTIATVGGRVNRSTVHVERHMLAEMTLVVGNSVGIAETVRLLVVHPVGGLDIFEVHVSSQMSCTFTGDLFLKTIVEAIVNFMRWSSSFGAGLVRIIEGSFVLVSFLDREAVILLDMIVVIDIKLVLRLASNLSS